MMISKILIVTVVAVKVKSQFRPRTGLEDFDGE